METNEKKVEESFSKTLWRRHASKYGSHSRSLKRAGAMAILADLMGTIKRGDHVPIVWRRAKDLRYDMGVGHEAFRNRIDDLVECGLLIEIKMHGEPGRRTLLVAKRAEQNEVDALLCAANAVRRYRRVPVNVKMALSHEIEVRGFDFDIFGDGVLEERTSTVENRQTEIRKPEQEASYRETKTQNENSGVENLEIEAPSPIRVRLQSAFDQKTLREFLEVVCVCRGSSMTREQQRSVAELYNARYSDTLKLRLWLLAKLSRIGGKYSGRQMMSFFESDLLEFDGELRTLNTPARPTPKSENHVCEGEHQRWKDAKARLRKMCSDTFFANWFESLEYSEVPGKGTLLAPDSFFADFIATSCWNLVTASFSGFPVTVEGRA